MTQDFIANSRGFVIERIKGDNVLVLMAGNDRARALDMLKKKRRATFFRNVIYRLYFNGSLVQV